jgi:AcrR family transcriptional regulator
LKSEDPRYIRTRNLIMEAFLQLVIEKKYEQITIKDITARATVNRATFYYHFLDKIDLSEKVMKEILLREVLRHVSSYKTLTNETVISIFKNLIAFQQGIKSSCSKSFEAFSCRIEEAIKEQLFESLLPLMKAKHPSLSQEQLESKTALLSWGMYGVLQKHNPKKPLNDQDLSKLFEMLI